MAPPPALLALDSRTPTYPDLPLAVPEKARYDAQLRKLLIIPGMFELGIDYDHQTHVSAILESAGVPECLHDHAMHIFFAQNTFYFANPCIFDTWVYSNPSWAPLLRRIGVDVVGESFTHFAKPMKRCSGLKALHLGVDEREMVRRACSTGRGQQRLIMPPTEIDLQLNIVVLLGSGMDSFRTIRLDHVEFVPFHVHICPGHRTGPIPRGILETLVAEEIMQRPKKKPTAGSLAVQPFRLLDLPPELRNYIYRFVLSVDGKINPIRRTPTSYIRSGLNRQRSSASATRPGPEPSSVLAFVQINRQIYEEATSYFYSVNQFVFYYPDQVLEFLRVLNPFRKDHITAVTLWYPRTGFHEALLLESAFRELKQLPALKKLEIILEDEPPAHLGYDLARHRPGERKLKKFVHTGVVDVTIKSMKVENFLWDSAEGPLDHGSGPDACRQTKQAVDAFAREIHTWP
ncbi:hypothetical protein K491DRAFT_716708 [Lophiostoma macrostomum CBS 122681]|uniref:DUF7730 domain-containing protein n=1 Tax=Lophiostoma macrostomum CBS 122681 TaxID=1314788 RepID=A0A6A6T7N6_9PLEO|nr:hypothetical protein K491DRAFT_716708 [Lophiostoma macrostomum CBS 122681]